MHGGRQSARAALLGTLGRRDPGTNCLRSGTGLAGAVVACGQPTPVAAATWFANHSGGPILPRDGWRVVDAGPDGATLGSGSSTVHVVRGRDGTWQVDGGTRCR